MEPLPCISLAEMARDLRDLVMTQRSIVTMFQQGRPRDQRLGHQVGWRVAESDYREWVAAGAPTKPPKARQV